MVNRDTNFNRKKVNKLKSIRDKKKARALRKRRDAPLKETQSRPLTKKEEKKQKRLERIYKELAEKDHTFKNVANIFEKKQRKRRNKNKAGHKQETEGQKEGMQIDN